MESRLGCATAAKVDVADEAEIAGTSRRQLSEFVDCNAD